MAKYRWGIGIVFFLVVILVGWVAFVSSKQVERHRRIQNEISVLETEAAKIRRENGTLAEKIRYFSSDDFREQEAKKKLSLKKSEETAVVIKSVPEYGKEDIGDEQHGSPSVPIEDDRGDIPNYKKWWNIFF